MPRGPRTRAGAAFVARTGGDGRTLRKLFALGGGMVLALAGVAFSPAEADEVTAWVTGAVVNTGTCNTKNVAYGGDGTNDANGDPGEAGQAREFNNVRMIGNFQAGLSVYAGPLFFGDLAACSVARGPLPGTGPVPDLLHRFDGFLTAGGFGTGSGFFGINETGDLVCLDGWFDRGGRIATTAEQTTASISVSWEVFPVNPVTLTCGGHGATPIASGSADLVLATTWDVGLGFQGALVADPTASPIPEPIAIDLSDMSPCTVEVLVDPFFEIRRSDWVAPERSVCVVLTFPVRLGVRVTVR